MVYLSEPSWELQGKRVLLRGQFPVSDPRKYVEKKGNVAFTTYKCYSVQHQRIIIENAMKANEPLPKPELVRQDILLNSDEMIRAMRSYFSQFSSFRTEFPELDVNKRICEPYIWWYHYRKHNTTANLQPRQARLVTTLTDWIEANYGSHYDSIDRQFCNGRVSQRSMEYLIRPGDILISNSDSGLDGFVAKRRPRLLWGGDNATARVDNHNLNAQWYWRICSHSFIYVGDFRWKRRDIDVKFETGDEDEEFDIANLNVVPLDYV